MEDMSRATHAVAVKLQLWNDGRLLLLKRRADLNRFPGLWDLPGGRLEPGETAHNGLVREVREETGLSLEKARILSVWDHQEPGVTMIGLSFLAHIDATKIALSDEHTDFAWITPEETGAYKAAPNLSKEIAWVVSKGWHRPSS